MKKIFLWSVVVFAALAAVTWLWPRGQRTESATAPPQATQAAGPIGTAASETVAPPPAGAAQAESSKPIAQARPVTTTAQVYPGEPIAAVLRRGTKTLTPTPNQVGHFEQVLVDLGERIPAAITYPAGDAGETVVVQMQDGGQLDNGTITKISQLDEERTVRFVAEMSQQDGLHRVELLKGSDRKVLEFWAGEPPPPVR